MTPEEERVRWGNGETYRYLRERPEYANTQFCEATCRNGATCGNYGTYLAGGKWVCRVHHPNWPSVDHRRSFALPPKKVKMASWEDVPHSFAEVAQLHLFFTLYPEVFA